MHYAKWSITKDFLTPAQCDHIVEVAELFNDVEAKIDRFGKPLESEVAEDIRKCNLCFLTPMQAEEVGLHEEVGRIYEAVDSQFNSVLQFMELSHLDITGHENFQYTECNAGDHYDWHQDSFRMPYPSHYDEYKQEPHDLAGYVRKMSISIFLNDPDEWEGGELEIENPWGSKPEAGQWEDRIVTFDKRSKPISKGSAIIFQSDCWHRVKPVVSGNRKTLVCWYVGPPHI